MESCLQIITHKPKVLIDWIEYFIQFNGCGAFSANIYAQPYAYILFNQKQSIEISYQNKNIQTKKSILEPVTLLPFTMNAKIDKTTMIFGAKIRSTFLYMLTGIPLYKLNGSIFNFDEIFDEKINLILEQIYSAKTISERADIAEKYFLFKINSFQKINLIDSFNAMKYLTQNFYSVFNIDQLINKLNVSHRTLDRHFLKYTGVSPKAMLSLIRFSKIIDYAIKYKSFNLEILWNFGYYDYAHFSRDFKKYSGKSFENFKQEIKFGENLQVAKQNMKILLPEILIY